jgi:ArsR family transcriptional regulator
MGSAIDMARLRPAAEQAAALMRVLGNPDRLLLLCELAQGELCVGDLSERTGILQPTLSQQLTVLREQALVETRREGRLVFYAIADARALAVLKTLNRQYCGRA